ncbi:hypothetical protein [Methylotenera sp. L2L1]|uniref:hypothetical protein n=1 Tax=Methylotenera sp. L2L1 TaxID=1502770 RepID=UPI00056D48CF|nr:hypothetical protein [Methylotenera sp. L2L1]
MIKAFKTNQMNLKTVLFMLLLVIPISLITGFITALGVKQLDMLWIAALGGVALLALSNATLIWGVAVMALLVVGQAMYFAGFNQAVWIPYGLGMLFFLRMPMVYANSPFSRLSISPPLVFPVLIFIGAVILSMLINTSQPFQAFRAAKSYIFLWSVFLLIAYFGVKLDTLNKLWRFCILVVFIQLPLVLYQYLFVASKRSNLGGLHGVSWDAIVGGFGGDPMGGGASGTMAWFLVFTSVLCVALYRRNLISKWLLAGALVISAICIGLAEVKVVVLLLPLGMAAIFAPYLKKNPFKVMLALLVSVLVAFGVLVLYGFLRSKTGSFDLDIIEILNDAFWYSLDPNNINFVTGEMGRVASFVHWWQENGFNNPLHTLFGHGPGSSSSSGVFGVGEVARKYSFDINRSTLSIFLWDIGLIGVLSYLFIIFKGLSLALKASKLINLEPFQAAVSEAIFGGLLMVLVMLPYGKDVTEVPALGVLLMFFLGYVSQSVSQHKITAKTKSDYAY